MTRGAHLDWPAERCWNRPRHWGAVTRLTYVSRGRSSLAAADPPAFLLEVSMSTISEVLGRRVQLKGLIGKRAMKCPYCDFYFMKNGSDLQRHIWAHEGEYSSFGVEPPFGLHASCGRTLGGSRLITCPAVRRPSASWAQRFLLLPVGCSRGEQRCAVLPHFRGNCSEKDLHDVCARQRASGQCHLRRGRHWRLPRGAGVVGVSRCWVTNE